MPAISVLVPVYNAVPFLEQCLDSVRNQSFTDFEVICLNDGSTDDSLETLNRFAQQDKRFVVIDKENEGYGKTLNRGLTEARGEFVSIIEPDDFIEPTMFEDLYDFAQRAANKGAVLDVIKCSYWEYFDSTSDYNAPLVASPALRWMMPQSPIVFSLEENQNIICAHPSIWSAIYRRQFLSDNKIFFVEPQGAGWADNPFLYETMLLASKIGWLPGGYYYYRQTNTNASSLLKDYRIPFDRLREIRAFLSRNNPPEDILAAFYHRELDYINDIVHVFGFDENDLRIRSAIMEVINSMDERIVREHPRLGSFYIASYDHFANPITFSSHEEEINPDISILVPIGVGDTQLALETIQHIASFELLSFECICAGIGQSKEGSSSIKKMISPDKRISYLGNYADCPEALNQVASSANGRFALVCNPGDSLNEKELCEKISSMDTIADCFFCLQSGPRTQHIRHFAEGAINSTKTPWRIDKAKDRESILSSLPFASCNVLFSPHVIAQGNVRFEEDCSAHLRFAISLLEKAKHPVAAIGSFGSNFEANAPKSPSPFPSPSTDCEAQPMLHTQAVMYSKPNNAQSEKWAKAWRNLLLTAFISDLHLASNETAAKDLLETHLNFVSREVLGGKDPWNYYDHEAYNELAFISARGTDSYLYRLYCSKHNELRGYKANAFALQNRINQLEDTQTESKTTRSLEKNAADRAFIRIVKRMLGR